MNDSARKSLGPLPVHQPTYAGKSLTSYGLGGEKGAMHLKTIFDQMSVALHALDQHRQQYFKPLAADPIARIRINLTGMACSRQRGILVLVHPDGDVGSFVRRGRAAWCRVNGTDGSQ